MREFFLLGFGALTFFCARPAQAAVTNLCNVHIESPEEIDFSGTEENWLCGEKDSAAWKRVPVPQQQLFLKGFLQDRGYHDPKFTVTAGGDLNVSTGPAQRVKAFSVVGAPPGFDPSKRRRLKGEILNKASLDDASSWTRRQLQYIGYPCPKVTPVAITDSNEIRLTVEPGPKTTFGIVEDAPAGQDLHPGVIDRFTAFQPDQSFDVRLLELTSSRILLEDLYMSSYYDVLCGENTPPKAVRRFVAAKPRLLTVGLGFDSEQGPIVRTRFKWTRIDTPANSLETTLFASFREQTITNNFRYHLSPNVAPNLELVPNLTVSHREEARGEILSTSAGVNIAHTWENRGWQLKAEAGPSLNYDRTIRGNGNSDIRAVRVNSQVTARSHLYEYFQSDPRTGWIATLNTTSQFKDVLARQTYHRVQLKHEMLFNLGRFDPPFLILGWRGLIGTYLFNNRHEQPMDISALDRFSLGGNTDIRGYDRQRLPGNKQGFTTAIYQGLELRAGTWFSFDVQPFVFFDFAMGGFNSLQLNDAIYYSPGVGLRYKSPFGTLRTTLGRGLASNRLPSDPEPGWQFYFTFGEEF